MITRETEKLEGGNQVAGTACVEKFLATYSKFLHPNHAFLSRLKQMLCEGAVKRTFSETAIHFTE